MTFREIDLQEFNSWKEKMPSEKQKMFKRIDVLFKEGYVFDSFSLFHGRPSWTSFEEEGKWGEKSWGILEICLRANFQWKKRIRVVASNSKELVMEAQIGGADWRSAVTDLKKAGLSIERISDAPTGAWVIYHIRI